MKNERGQYKHKIIKKEELVRLGIEDGELEEWRGEPEDISQVVYDDVVSLYLRQMASEELLTAQEEVGLAKRIEIGKEAIEVLRESEWQVSEEEMDQFRDVIADSRQARKSLGRANARLVVSIAKKYQGSGLEMSDLIAEGNIGLMLAVDKFDYRLGNRFSTYATWWIRQTITRALSQKSRIIRLPLHLAEKYWRGEELDEETKRMVEQANSVQEIDEPVTPGGDELGEFIMDTEGVSPESAVRTLIADERVREIVKKGLSSRKWRVISLRFGISENGEPQEEMTLDQVGEVMGLSRERIRQLEKSAFYDLKNALMTWYQLRKLMEEYNTIDE